MYATQSGRRNRVDFNATELLTVPEASERLGLPEWTVRRAVDAAGLARKVGRDRIILGRDLPAIEAAICGRGGPRTLDRLRRSRRTAAVVQTVAAPMGRAAKTPRPLRPGRGAGDSLPTTRRRGEWDEPTMEARPR